MRWLLDTNVVSELWKDKPNAGAVAWVEENKDECAVSEITFAELYYGIHRLPFGKRRAELLRYAHFLREDYRDAILGVNAIEAESWGEHALKSLPRAAKNTGPLGPFATRPWPPLPAPGPSRS